MILTSNSQPGLAISGTKDKKSVFFTFNVSKELADVNELLKDFRGIAEGINQTFYSIDNLGKLYSLSIIHAIHDEGGVRLGYLAISLLIPERKIISGDRVVSFLDGALSEYLRLYVINDFSSKKIRKGVREDSAIFEKRMANANLQLRDDENYDQPGNSTFVLAHAGKRILYLRYGQQPGDLAEYFQHHSRPELRSYERILLLPNVENDLTAKITFTKLPPPIRWVAYEIWVQDSNGHILPGVQLTVTQPTANLITDTGGNARFKAKEEDKPIIYTDLAGYKPRTAETARPGVFTEKTLGVRDVMITLNPVEKRKETPLEPVKGPLIPLESINNPIPAEQKPEKKWRLPVLPIIITIAVLGFGYALYYLLSPPREPSVKELLREAKQKKDTYLSKRSKPTPENDTIDINSYLGDVKTDLESSVTNPDSLTFAKQIITEWEKEILGVRKQMVIESGPVSPASNVRMTLIKVLDSLNTIKSQLKVEKEKHNNEELFNSLRNAADSLWSQYKDSRTQSKYRSVQRIYQAISKMNFNLPTKLVIKPLAPVNVRSAGHGGGGHRGSASARQTATKASKSAGTGPKNIK